MLAFNRKKPLLDLPEFFIEKRRYEKMAISKKELKRRKRLKEDILMFLEAAYYVSAIAVCTAWLSYTTGLWAYIFLE